MSALARFRLAAVLLLVTSSFALATPPTPEFVPQGYDMLEYFPVRVAGVTWRYEEGDNWVELTTEGLQEFEGRAAYAVSAVEKGEDRGTRYFSASGHLEVFYVKFPGGSFDFRDEPLAFSAGKRAYEGDRISAAPRSFMGGTILTTVEIMDTSETTVPFGAYPEALRTHTTMTHLPSGEVISAFDSWYAKDVGMIRTAGFTAEETGLKHFDQVLVEIRR